MDIIQALYCTSATLLYRVINTYTQANYFCVTLLIININGLKGFSMFSNKRSLLALSVASAIALSGCGSDNDGNTVTPPVVTPPPVVVAPEAPAELSSVVIGNVVDDATQDVVTATISFFESGMPATNLVDIDGTAFSSVETDDGSFTFQLKEGATVSEVTAVVTADTYLTKSYIIDLSDLTESDVEIQLPLVAEVSEGVAVEKAEKSVSGGSSADALEVETKSGKAAASVTIPSGTTLQDADGNAIQGDSVKFSLVAADSNSTAAAAITPEGLNASNTTNVLTPVGVTSVEMVDSNGVKIKKFSQPITIQMAIPEDKGYTTGDQLALVSQDEDTGVWTEESQKVTVGDLVAADNYYNASFETDHLTFFSAVESNTACNAPLRVLVAGSAVPAGGLFVNLKSSDYAVKGRLKANASDAVLLSTEKVAQKGIVAGATAKVNVTDANGNVWYSSDNEVNVCGDVNVTLENPVSYVDQSLSLVAQCSNDDAQTTVASGALVKYSLTGKAKKVASGSKGVYALNSLVDGETYAVTVTYKGTLASIGTKTYSIAADGTDKSQTETIECSTTTGGN